MKKLTMIMMTALMMLAFTPILKAGTSLAANDSTRNAVTAESTILISRLNEIHEMDKANMKSPEKRKLRKEVRSIENKLGHGGVYISVGGVLLILLLLIILL